MIVCEFIEIGGYNHKRQYSHEIVLNTIGKGLNFLARYLLV